MGLLPATQMFAAKPLYTETHSFERGGLMRAWPPKNNKFLSVETAEVGAGAKAEANYGNAATKGYALPKKYWLYHDL